MGVGYFEEIDMGINVDSVAKGEIRFGSSGHNPTIISALRRTSTGWMDALESKDSTDLFTFKQSLHLLDIPQITFDSSQPFITRKFRRLDNIGRDDPQLWEKIKEELSKLSTNESYHQHSPCEWTYLLHR